MPKSCFMSIKNKRKTILKDVNFRMDSGQMLAILGSSGSGKTTLLDVISNRHNGGQVEGSVKINGKNRTKASIRRCSAYVRQDDRLLPHLTVKETLFFVGRLKLPSSYSSKEVKERIDDVIAELGLGHVSDTKVGGPEVRGVSGGERRRVSIGVDRKSVV